MRLVDLLAQFTQVMPLGTGIYTGITYVCPNDPRRRRAHWAFFTPIINPYPIETVDAEALERYLNSNEGWRVSPKWTRVSGETLNTLTLSPSLAWPCCHSVLTNGAVVP